MAVRSLPGFFIYGGVKMKKEETITREKAIEGHKGGGSMNKTVPYSSFNDLYNRFTLTITKIKKLSEMTCDDEAVVIMDMVEDILAAEHKKIDKIREKALKAQV
ncbi:MAG: hypothetical protein CVU54_14660 [Deltaproteobacteria bacterium HGW-Deltaproteobacteria-12]|nr:MAG: hypothetical protein CVU54_14660 [Deltaproteobacteria bacterium HGW-Deltaproteobacteria-12]